MAYMNIIDYLDWRGDIPLSVAPFNPVDSLILSELAYTHMGDVPHETVREAARAMLERGATPHDEPMCRRMAESVRFGDARIPLFKDITDAAREMQFAAGVFVLDDGTAYVAYRGTDATIIGWKEDFNMSFESPVAGQVEALRFLRDAAALLPGVPLRVGGHSKGGNFAVYAAALCAPDTQGRIVQVYNHDGPGQTDKFMQTDGYRAVAGKVLTYLPQSSVVGMLLEHPEEYQVIRSDSVGGILQHDPYKWCVLRDGFVEEGRLRTGSLYLDKAVKAWLVSIDVGERKRAIDAIYELLSATHAEKVTDLASDWRKNAAALISAMSGLNPDTRKLLMHVSGAFISALIAPMKPQSAPDESGC